MGNVFDLHHDCSAVMAFASQAINSDTTTSGATIDLKGYEAIEFIFLTKTITDGDYHVVIYEGDESDMSDESVVAAAETFGDINFTDDTDDNTVARMGVASKKRYVRSKVVSTNVTTGVDIITGVALRANAHHKPVAAQNG